MSITRQLEEKILAELATRIGSLANVVGFRRAVSSGAIKESTGGKPEVRVTVSPGITESYSTQIMEYPVKVAVNLDLEDDPTQAAFDTVAEKVERMIEDFNANANRATMSTALSSTNFRVDGFRADGGSDGIDLNRDNPRIYTTYAFALKGVIQRTNS